MGCEDCKVMAQSEYERCQKLRNTKKRPFEAPCGAMQDPFGFKYNTSGGSNYTPPKKRRRKR